MVTKLGLASFEFSSLVRPIGNAAPGSVLYSIFNFIFSRAHLFEVTDRHLFEASSVKFECGKENSKEMVFTRKVERKRD